MKEIKDLGASRSPVDPGGVKPRRQALEDLLAGVEAAEGPSKELDGAIFVALECVPNDGREGVHGWTFKPAFSPYLHQERGDWHPAIEGDAPAYTACLDAALALVERVLPGWLKFVGDLDPSDMRASATLAEGLVGSRTTRGFAPQGRYALAVLSALLNALLSSEDQPIGLATRSGPETGTQG